MDETTEGTAFVPLATIVAFISSGLLFLRNLFGPNILWVAKAWSQNGPIP